MISVIIPSYNRAKTIERSAKSVLNQTYKDIELIIVDDCSFDNTGEIVEKLMAKDSRVRYIRHDVNQGACAARNTGIDAAKGEYIAFQDSDDVWYENKLEVQLTRLQASGADICFCRYVRVRNGEIRGIGPNYKDGFQDPLVNLWEIGTQTLMGKRAVFKENYFDSTLPRFQELELLIRITKKHKLFCVEEPLVQYNIENKDAISSNPIKTYRAINIILEKHPDLLSTLPELGKNFSFMLLVDVSYANKEQNIRKSDIYKLALKCDHSLKCHAMVLLRILGLFDILIKMRRSFAAKSS